MNALRRSMLAQMSLSSVVVIGAGAWFVPDAPGWLPALGVFAACAGVVAVQTVRLRRMARDFVRQEETQHLRPFAEYDLPTEVSPLVGVVNARIARVAERGERQNFFLSAAAHEMRTPLTVVRMRLEQLDGSVLKDQLVADVRRLTHLVNDLLTLMSIRGRERVMKPVDLAARCARVIDALDTVAGARAVKLVLEAQAAIPPVSGDAGLIEVAVTNLVQNAIAHSPLGGRVTIAIAPGPRITVSDQGSGIPEAQRETLFDPFVRLSATPGGYGLGLTIVRAVADVHRARVQVDEAPGGGGAFILDFA